LVGDINKSKGAVVLFDTDANPTVSQKALDILTEAERRTGLPTNAVTGFHEKSGTTEFDETIRNLAHHLSRPGNPVTEAQARSLLENLAQ
jgi:hypothetical protein